MPGDSLSPGKTISSAATAECESAQAASASASLVAGRDAVTGIHRTPFDLDCRHQRR